MATERDELLDHNYDGIREYNNPLPNWWLWLFYGTILFALVYVPYYLFGWGASPAEEYQQELTAAAAVSRPAAPPAGAAQEAPPAPATADDLAAGAAIFATNCVPCHGPQAQGLIGPNLTDNYWIHGNKLSDLIQTITNGVPDKGMIAWKAMLNPEKIRQVASYVKSLRGSNPPNPKPPQGQEYPNE